jgi:RNA polymerase sigma-70 factor (ECF subfamily)
MDYAALAGVLERSEPACRQLAARGRDHVRESRARFETTEAATARLASAFYAAVTSGDLPALARVLADDAVFYSDGGGKRPAAINPVFGKDKILRLMIGLAGKRGIPTPDQLRIVLINGTPGVVVHSDDGIETFAIEIAGQHIVAIYSIRNPDKLRHLA